MQIELDARAVLEHLEADGVLAADEFLFGIDANVEMVEEQIVVGAVGTVRAAQDVRLGGLVGGTRRLWCSGLLRSLLGGLRRSLCRCTMRRD